MPVQWKRGWAWCMRSTACSRIVSKLAPPAARSSRRWQISAPLKAFSDMRSSVSHWMVMASPGHKAPGRRSPTREWDNPQLLCHPAGWRSRHLLSTRSLSCRDEDAASVNHAAGKALVEHGAHIAAKARPLLLGEQCLQCTAGRAHGPTFDELVDREPEINVHVVRAHRGKSSRVQGVNETVRLGKPRFSGEENVGCARHALRVDVAPHHFRP